MPLHMPGTGEICLAESLPTDITPIPSDALQGILLTMVPTMGAVPPHLGSLLDIVVAACRIGTETKYTVVHASLLW